MSTTDAALWRRRFLRFAIGGSAPLAGGVLGILRNKWLAVHLEAAGLGVLAQVIAGQNWLGAVCGLGMGVSLARVIGSATAKDDEDAIRRATSTASTLIGLCSLAICAAGLIAAPAISRALLGTDVHATLVRISLLGVIGFAAQGLAQGVFAGRSDVRAPLTLAVVGGMVALLATLVLVPRFGLAGGALGSALLFPVGVAGAFAIHRRGYARLFSPRPRPRIDSATARGLLAVGSAALGLSLADQGTMIALRSHYLRANGIEANGLLQSAVALAQQFGGLFYAYLTGYAFGKISGERDAAGVAAYTRRHWIPFMLLAATASAIAITATTPLLHLFYSSRFDPARPMLAWMLFGEYARIGAQVWALGALPLGGVALWLPIGFSSTAALAVSYVAWTRAGAGALSLPLAYATGNLAALLFAALWMARRGVRLGVVHALVTLAAIGGLFALATAIAR
jgi:O-antigen/teichoic acid export membrane protein